MVVSVSVNIGVFRNIPVLSFNQVLLDAELPTFSHECWKLGFGVVIFGNDSLCFVRLPSVVDESVALEAKLSRCDVY